MRTGNPVLKEDTFNIDKSMYERPMTIEGTTNKTMVLLFIVVMSATFSWFLYFDGEQILLLILIFTIIAFGIGLITTILHLRPLCMLY
ncbi:MAG: hypothetical protein GX072_10435 [Lysinibacillus sp.]|nr:hypothetical protein [Lysinibacillus sp.]